MRLPGIDKRGPAQVAAGEDGPTLTVVRVGAASQLMRLVNAAALRSRRAHHTTLIENGS
jgi:hypothetical protein